MGVRPILPPDRDPCAFDIEEPDRPIPGRHRTFGRIDHSGQSSFHRRDQITSRWLGAPFGLSCLWIEPGPSPYLIDESDPVTIGDKALLGPSPGSVGSPQKSASVEVEHGEASIGVDQPDLFAENEATGRARRGGWVEQEPQSEEDQGCERGSPKGLIRMCRGYDVLRRALGIAPIRGSMLTHRV
jgi:hypothetical protein